MIVGGLSLDSPSAVNLGVKARQPELARVLFKTIRACTSSVSTGNGVDFFLIYTLPLELPARLGGRDTSTYSTQKGLEFPKETAILRR